MVFVTASGLVTALSWWTTLTCDGNTVTLTRPCGTTNAHARPISLRSLSFAPLPRLPRFTGRGGENRHEGAALRCFGLAFSRPPETQSLMKRWLDDECPKPMATAPPLVPGDLVVCVQEVITSVVKATARGRVFSERG